MINADQQEQLTQLINEYAVKTVDARVQLHLDLHQTWMKKVDAYLKLFDDTFRKQFDVNSKQNEIMKIILNVINIQGSTYQQIALSIQNTILASQESAKELDVMRKKIESQDDVLKTHSEKFNKVEVVCLWVAKVLFLIGVIITTIIVTLNWDKLNTIETWKDILLGSLTWILPLAYWLFKGSSKK